MNDSRLEIRVVPFARRWHVIHEIDLVGMIAEHRRRAAICAWAELIADGLPNRPDDEGLGRFLGTLDDMATRIETGGPPLWDTTLRHGDRDPLGTILRDHVRDRHMADAAAAREVIAAFDVEADTASETLGYILRGFFAACRGGVEFEQLAVLALAGHRLTPDARAVLTDALAQGFAH
ncbi:hypothetical protein ACQKJZ_00295 [Sphingomonas sp. NPDC019816]|uniref:hypothetical protein n=1 Tax=Sphingomonas sp. NPDC019816 TaxID=3390679 RepID=UPI003D091C94